MRAAVCREFGAPLVVEDLVLDPPSVGEVRVTMKAAAVCGSDIHAANGAWGGELPVVLGHEAAGVVAELGDGVTGLDLGDHVVVSLLRDCGSCFFCLRKQPYLCEKEWSLKSVHRIHQRDGGTIHQGIYVGAFAEEVIVQQEQCVVVPSDIPLDSASLLACGVITGYGAVVNTAGVEPGSSVVVIGAGGVGLNSVQGASANQASRVIVLDTAAEKLDIARRFGATHAFGATDGSVPDQIADLTSGRGADYVFVTVGSPAAVEQALTLVRRGGTVVVVGIGAGEAHAKLRIRDFASDAHRILGSKMGDSVLERDIPQLIARYQQNQLLLDELITSRFSLDDINQAIAGVGVGSTLRNVVVFE